MRFLFSFLLILLFFGLFAVFAIFGIIRSFFGIGKKSNAEQNGHQQDFNKNQTGNKTKIFDKSDGEYVDYEDVKD
ncbi:MAG: DUF4834 family protein [Paludibacter sp.]|nr:DUF4834 family protein [Paludibacter sp.]